VYLVPTLLPNLGIGPCAFFCLALVPAVCKTFGFTSSVKSQLKKNTKTNDVPHDTPCGTLKDKIL